MKHLKKPLRNSLDVKVWSSQYVQFLICPEACYTWNIFWPNKCSYTGLYTRMTEKCQSNWLRSLESGWQWLCLCAGQFFTILATNKLVNILHKSLGRYRTFSSEDLCKFPALGGTISLLLHLRLTETGLLSDCLMLFRGAKSSMLSNYHTEMILDAFIS